MMSWTDIDKGEPPMLSGFIDCLDKHGFTVSNCWWVGGGYRAVNDFKGKEFTHWRVAESPPKLNKE